MSHFLAPLYFLYKSAGQIRSALFEKSILRSTPAPLPTVSVGNISFGGTHKTPLSMHLLAFLKQQGYKPAFISRGYKGTWEHRGGTLSDGKHIYGGWEESGDESYMVAKNFPEIGVFIGKNRHSSCQEAHTLGFDIAVLDDGFQHQQLKRDVDIVLFDPREKTALRESISALKRAHFILIEKSLMVTFQKQIDGLAPDAQLFSFSAISKGFFAICTGEPEILPAFKNKKIVALSGIAHPERFKALLKDQGVKPYFSLTFPDHFSYPRSSIKKIVDVFNKHDADMIITTEKDSVKLQNIKDFNGIPMYYLKMDLKIEDKFYKSLLLSLKNIQTQI